MEKEVTSNKVKINLNYEAIARDFDIFMITKNDSLLEKTDVLNLSCIERKARAVQYTWGKTAFVLFDKGAVTEDEFRHELEEEFGDVIVQLITSDKLFDSDFRSRTFFYGDRLLCQLLINSLSAPKSEKYAYNNIVGKLYYSQSNWKITNPENNEIRYYYFLNISLKPGMYLDLDVVTFGLTNNPKNKTQFILDKSGRLRKKLKTDEDVDPKKIFIIKSRKDKKTRVNFLDISSYRAFKNSKLGALEHFNREVKRLLGDYMVLEYESMPDDIYENNAFYAGMKLRDFGKILSSRGIRIVDDIRNEVSSLAVSQIQNELRGFYGVDSDVGSICEERYNIRLIHDPEFYEKSGIEDAHLSSDEYVVQHMIFEDYESKFTNNKSESKAFRKIIQEMIIKDDVIERRVNIFDWKGFANGKSWTFVVRKFIYEGDKRIGEFKLLKIDKDGHLFFEKFTDADIGTESEEHIVIMDKYDKLYKKYSHVENLLEGLMFSSVDNILAIVRTPCFAIPNIEGICDALKETPSNDFVVRDEILDGLKDFISDHKLSDSDIAHLIDFEDKISGMNLFIKRKQVVKALNMRKKVSKLFNRYLHANKSIWISPELKSSDMDYDLAGTFSNIHYYTGIDHDNYHFLSVYVGTKASMNLKIPCKLPVRRIISENRSFEVEDILPLLMVDFVRNNQYTVMPFPFKYLREWQG